MTDVDDNDDACATGGGATTSFASQLLDIPVTAGVNYYIRWLDTYTSSENPFDWTLAFTAAPDCPDVENITAVTNGDGSVDLDWDDAVGAAGYDYEIQPQGTAQGTAGALVMDSSATSDASVASGVLTDGTSYTLYVRSDCGSDMFGDYQSIDFTVVIPPMNIDCANATSIAYGQTIEDNSTGSTGTSEDIGCPTIGVNGLWFTFVGNGADVTVTSGASFDHRMAIGSGDCGTLVNVVCDDQSTQLETHTFTTVLNETYYVYIAHFSSGNTTTGEIFVTLTGADNIWDGMRGH